MCSSATTRGQTAAHHALWQRYSNNWVRHLGVVAERGDYKVREALEAAGYASLGQQLITPLSLLYLQKQRASTMAASLGVSQAYTAKVLNRLETSGYIERTEDAADRRARWVQLSPAGRRLIGAGLAQLKTVSLEHRRQLGGSSHRRLLGFLKAAGETLLSHERRLSAPGLHSELSAVSLSAVSELVQRAIGRLNSASGYDRLSIAHWRVFHDLGLEGSTNAVLAQRQKLSTQAISRTVRELLAMGFVERRRDESDGRVTKLVYSPRGLELLASTADNIDVLGRTVARELPGRAFGDFCHFLACLHGDVPTPRMPGAASWALGRQAGEQLKVEFAAVVDALLHGQGESAPPDALLSAADVKQIKGIIKARLPKD